MRRARQAGHGWGLLLNEQGVEAAWVAAGRGGRLTVFARLELAAWQLVKAAVAELRRARARKRRGAFTRPCGCASARCRAHVRMCERSSAAMALHGPAAPLLRGGRTCSSRTCGWPCCCTRITASTVRRRPSRSNLFVRSTRARADVAGNRGSIARAVGVAACAGSRRCAQAARVGAAAARSRRRSGFGCCLGAVTGGSR